MRVFIALAACIAFVSADAAAAQEPAETPFKPLRFDENWHAWCSGNAGSEAAPLKCIAVGDAHLSLGGDLRERVEVVRNPGFGLRSSDDHAFLHRAMVHADLHIGPAVRVFAQIGAFGYDGRPNGRAATDLDRLDLMQGFVEVSGQVAAEEASFRLGRQEMSFGSARLVAVRDGPNIRRTFDGGRATWSVGRTRIDGFVVRPVAIDPGVFDDRTDDAEHFWGVYATTLLTGPLHIDLYYLGLERDGAVFVSDTGQETRHSLGVRVFGEASGFDWDVEAVRQFGQFTEQNIAAWTVASDIGFTVRAAPLSPRIGVKADIASGDRSRGDGRLGTFNALYPKFPYFSEANLIAPANIVDLHPSVALHPTSALSFDLGWNPLWRQTKADAIYAPPLRAFPGTAGLPGRFIGHQSIAGFDWQATKRITIAGQYVHFEPGETLKSLGGKAGDFVVVSAAHRF